MWNDQHQTLLERYAAQYPPPLDDVNCRVWTKRLAEQFAYTFPSQGWGTKQADAGRPPSTDCICTRSPFLGYDVLLNQGLPHQKLAVDPKPLDLRGQIFIVVSAANHLAGLVDPPAPVVPPKASYPDEPTYWLAFQERIRKAYSDKGRVFPDPNDADAFRRFARCGFDIGQGMNHQQAADKHIAELRTELGL